MDHNDEKNSYWPGWKAPVGVALAALALYLITLAPTVLWGDFGGYQTRAFTGDIPAEQLLHPVWLYMIRPFLALPFGDIAYRVNLSSAVLGALTLLFLFRVIVRVTGSRRAAGLGVLVLAISHTFWIYSVVPKTYTLNTLVLALTLDLLLGWREDFRPWRIWLMAPLLGLSGSNHLIMLITLPGVAFFLIYYAIQSRRRVLWIHFFIAIPLFVVGLVPYGWLLARDAAQAAAAGIETPPGYLALLRWPRDYFFRFIGLFGMPRTLLFQVGAWVGALGYQFFFALIPALLGLRALWKRDRILSLVLLLNYLGVVAFVLVPAPSHGPVLQHWHLYITSYVVVAIWIGVGLEEVIKAGRIGLPGILLLILVPPLFTYTLFPVVAGPFVSRLGVRDIPYRDSATFLARPWKLGDVGARRFGDEIFEMLPEDAVIIADWTPLTPLEYLQQVEDARPDVTVIKLPDRGKQMATLLDYLPGERPIFLADTERYYDIEEMEEYFRIEPRGIIFELVRRGENE